MNIRRRILEKKIEFKELLEEVNYIGVNTKSDGIFDDRKTWDNWNNQGRDTFDDRKTWDNWDNRYFDNKKKG